VRFHNPRQHEFRQRRQRNLGIGRVKRVAAGGYVTYPRGEKMNIRRGASIENLTTDKKITP